MEQTKVCFDCGIEKPLRAFHKCFSGRLTGNKVGYDQRNPQGTVKNRCKQCYALRFWIKARLDFYDAMGGKCECCGETDIRFLTLDHRKLDGHIERNRGMQSQQIYLLARREGYPKDKYAILCYNCNCARSHRSKDGVCPHKSSESLEYVLSRMRETIRPVGRKYRNKESGPRPWKSKEMKGNKFAANLTVEKVLRIRELRGKKTSREIAEEFNVSIPNLYRIWNRQRWKDI